MTRTPLIILVLLALNQIGCGGTGYQQIDGDWCYIVVNAAVGREIREMEADAATFEVLANREYARDKRHAYRSGRILERVDGNSYRLLADTRYAVDRNAVYYQDFVIPEADPKTFELIEHPYGRDHTAVFCGTLKMDVASPRNFKTTSTEGSMKTTSFFYSAEHLVAEFGEDFKEAPVDEDHPVVLSDGSGTDGKWNYKGPRRVSAVD